MFTSLGEELRQFCLQAKHEILLVAPFVKLDALERVLAQVQLDVRVTCVTRWRLEEIAADVSDIDVWQVIKARADASLWLRSDLHAKYYRADESCLIGSANITATALGWTPRPNYELLIPIPMGEGLAEFERRLFAGGVQVDQATYERVQAIVEDFHPSNIIVPGGERRSVSIAEAIHIGPGPECWVPTLRTPEKLYVAYQGNLDALTTAARQTTLNDLAMLSIPPRLSQTQFEGYVGAALLQFPIIKRVDAFVAEPRRFGEVKALLAKLPCAESQRDFDAATAWQTMMRWLLHFLPTRYELSVPRYTEVFVRVEA